MIKAYKFRIYPTEEQATLINKTIGCARYVYNHFLAKRTKVYEQEQKTLSYNACSKLLTALKTNVTWLYEVDSTALQSSLKNLDKAYQKFFTKKASYPKFKSKRNSRQSYTAKGNIKVFESHIQLPKLGKVKYKKSREVEGKIQNATVRRTPTGKYFVSIACELDIKPLKASDSKIGVNLGISATCC